MQTGTTISSICRFCPLNRSLECAIDNSCRIESVASLITLIGEQFDTNSLMRSFLSTGVRNMLFWFCCNCFGSWPTSVCSPQCCKHSQAGFLNLAVCDLVWKPCHIPERLGHHHCHSGGTSLHQGQRTWQTLARNEGDLPQRCRGQGNRGSDALMLALLSYDLAKLITIVSVWIKNLFHCWVSLLPRLHPRLTSIEFDYCWPQHQSLTTI